MTKFSMGLDFGSNSVRALIISLADGKEFGSGVCTYPGGDSGVDAGARWPSGTTDVRNIRHCGTTTRRHEAGAG